jgi:uncharacterized protein
MYYVDTSVVIPLYIKEGTSNDCQTFVNSHKGNLALSHWTMVQVYSGFSLLKRTKAVQATGMTALTRAFEQQAKLYFSLINLQIADFLAAKDHLAHDTFGLNLRAGDALHIAIAKNNQMQLVTSDSHMAKAAKVFGVKVTHI